jgi:hypothetical protein
MNSLPDSVPYNIKVSFLQYQRREWEKVLESSKTAPAQETQPDIEQHWGSVNRYALEKLEEIDKQLQELKLVFDASPTASTATKIQ